MVLAGLYDEVGFVRQGELGCKVVVTVSQFKVQVARVQARCLDASTEHQQGGTQPYRVVTAHILQPLPSCCAKPLPASYLPTMCFVSLPFLFLQEVSSVKALVVMLVDLLDVSGTLMGKVRGVLVAVFGGGKSEY